MTSKTNTEQPYRILIVGGGAAGLELATRLGKKYKKNQNITVSLVDKNMTHLWKPLLHEVASGSLNSYSDELSYAAQGNWNYFNFYPGSMTQLDRTKKQITIESSWRRYSKLTDNEQTERLLNYDKLIIAVGSKSNDFNTLGVKDFCMFLDSREQAEHIHNRFLGAYLSAQDQDDNLNITIIGAGATGVELAAELRYTATALEKYTTGTMKPENVNITIIEGSNNILPALIERVQNGVLKQLKKLNINVIVGAIVKEVTAKGLITSDGRFIKSELKIWAAGIKAPSFLSKLDNLETNRINQLIVKPSLQTTLDDNIFAIGDCSQCKLINNEGNEFIVPPRAQAAHQQAKFIMNTIDKLIRKKPLDHFRYKDHGSLISLSNRSAVGNLMGNITGNILLEGFLARCFYISLYRLHQVALYGKWRTGLIMLKDLLERTTRPRLKLH